LAALRVQLRAVACFGAAAGDGKSYAGSFIGRFAVQWKYRRFHTEASPRIIGNSGR
jgi:hypothetical protein